MVPQVELQPVTDPALLAQLEGNDSDGLKPVTDPNLLSQLNAPQEEHGALMENVVRPVGRAARSIAGGVAGIGDLVKLVTDPLQNLASAGFKQAGFPTLAEASAPSPYSPSEAVKTMIDQATNNYLAPRDGFEKTIDTASEILGGGGGYNALAKGAKAVNAAPKVMDVLNSLATNTTKDLVGNTASGLALGEAQQETDNPLIQMAAAIAPTAIAKQASPTLGKLLGVNSTAVKELEQAGIKSNLGAVSDSPAVKTTFNAASKFPGSSSVIKKSLDTARNDINDQLSNFGLSKALTPQGAGDVIEEGITSYVDRNKARASKLYDSLDKQMEPKAQFSVSNTQSMLEDILQRSDNPAVVNDLAKSKGIGVVNDMLSGAFGGSKAFDGKLFLPYQDIKYWRTKIGSMLGDYTIVPNGDRAILKQIYSSLSDDLRDAAIAKGPKAVKTLDTANKFYANFMEDTEKNLASVVNKNTPEQMFQAVMQGTKLGGTKAESIMKGLNSQQREIVRGSVMQQLGGGVDNFDPVAMFRKYDKLAPEAKSAFFKGANSDLQDSFNKLATAVKRFDSIKDFSNPSGSGYITNIGLLGAGFGFGGLHGAAAAAKAVGGANLSARLLNSPKFINWLARGVAIRQSSPHELSKHIGRLSAISATNPELRDDITKYIDSLNETSSDENSNPGNEKQPLKITLNKPEGEMQ